MLFIVVLVCVCAMPASAQQSIDVDIADFAQENGIDFEQLTKAPFETLWSIVKDSLIKNTGNPFAVFYRITAILIVTAFIGFFASDKLSQVSSAVNTVTVLVIFSNVFTQFQQMSEETLQTFFDVKNFMVSFLPVFAGASFASGEIITSGIYTGFFLVAVVSVANFCINWIVPSVNVFVALGMVSALSSLINLKPLCDFYTKTIKIAMTSAVSVLCFVLSLQTAITQGQDSLAIKTGKLIVTTAVPVIGSALQGAVGSVYASMSVLKGFCGIAGIGALLAVFLPHIVKLAVSWLGFMAVGAFSEMLENSMVHRLLSVFRGVTEIMLSVTVLFAVLLIFCITIMIKTIQV